tara:strand:+ start:61 stop:534 length:474 start_codon:yes stop_codon:yes gene_type:complete
MQTQTTRQEIEAKKERLEKSLDLVNQVMDVLFKYENKTLGEKTKSKLRADIPFLCCIREMSDHFTIERMVSLEERQTGYSLDINFTIPGSHDNKSPKVNMHDIYEANKGYFEGFPEAIKTYENSLASNRPELLDDKKREIKEREAEAREIRAFLGLV